MFSAFGKRSYSCRTQPHKGLCAKLHCHISTDLNFSGSMSQIQITCPGTWDFVCSLKTKHQISDWAALFRKMSKISLSKQSFHIKCSLKTKPVSIKHVKNYSLLLQGKDRGSGALPLWKVCVWFGAAEMPWLQALQKTNPKHQVGSSSSPVPISLSISEILTGDWRLKAHVFLHQKGLEVKIF